MNEYTKAAITDYLRRSNAPKERILTILHACPDRDRAALQLAVQMSEDSKTYWQEGQQLSGFLRVLFTEGHKRVNWSQAARYLLQRYAHKPLVKFSAN